MDWLMKKGKSAWTWCQRAAGLADSQDIEAECEDLIKSANLLKLEKRWEEAGDIFAQCADLCNGEGNRGDAAANYSEAGNCYEKDGVVSGLKKVI